MTFILFPLVCTTAFYKPRNLADAMLEFRNASFGARPSAFVKGVRVKTIHLDRRKTVKTLSNFNAKQFTFFVDDYNAELTVEQYFKRSEDRSDMRHIAATHQLFF